MRILQICKKVPYPLHDGESIAVNALSRAYFKQGHDVDLLCMNTSRHKKDMTQVRIGLKHYRKIVGIDVNNQITLSGLVKSLFDKIPYHVSRITSSDFDRAIIEYLQADEYDVIQMETVYPMIYIKTIQAHTDAKIVLRAHNVEHIIWQRVLKDAPIYQRWYLHLQCNKIARFEEQYISQCDHLIPVSEDDYRVFKNMGFNKECTIIPIGLDIDDYELRPKRNSSFDPLTLGFIGTLDWIPNVQGLLWFLEDVWPSISKKFGDKILFKIAGKNMPQSISRHASTQVKVLGHVPDAKEFVRSCDVMIVPLLAGSGQRVKILEAMALGVPVLSTTIGVEAIHAESGRDYILANEKRDFINALDDVLNKKIDLTQIAVQGRAFVTRHHDADQIVTELISSIFTK